MAYPVGILSGFMQGIQRVFYKVYMRYMRYIRDIILLKQKFNWGILRSWASPDFPSQKPYIYRVSYKAL